MTLRILEKNFLTISYSEFWDKINYYGIQSILILLLTKNLGFTDSNSFAIYGVYTALTFGFSILGGIIADKMLGLLYTAILGCALLFIGNIILVLHNPKFIFIGLAFIVVGFGLIKPSTPSLIGLIHTKNSNERDKAFSVFYFCLNIGSISGPLFYGFFFHLNQNWLAYLLGGLGIFSALFFLFLNRKFITTSQSVVNTKKALIAAVILIFSVLISYLLLTHKGLAFWIFLLAIIISLYLLLKFLKNISDVEKSALIKLISPIIACVVFFSVLLQIYSSLTLFIDRYINKSIFGWKVPTAWFSSIEPVMLLLLVPILNAIWSLFSKRKKEVNPQNKTIIGLIVAGIAFLLFSVVARISDSNQIIVLLILFFGYTLLAISELSIIPVTISLTNLLAPQNYKNTMMGVFYFSLTLSGYLSSVLIKFSASEHSTTVLSSNFFLVISVFLFLITIFLFFLNKVINKFAAR